MVRKTKSNKYERLEFIKAIENGELENVKKLFYEYKDKIIHNPIDISKYRDFHKQELFVLSHDGSLLKNVNMFTNIVNLNTLNMAIKTGIFENIKWLYENGCTWNQNTFTIAVNRGDVDIIEWLREVGCPTEIRTLENY